MTRYLFISIACILFACTQPASDSQAQSTTTPAPVNQAVEDAKRSFTGTHWIVVELNGQNVENKTAKEMNLLFDPGSPQFKGHTGCTMIMGEAKRSGTNSLLFTNLLYTEGACNTPEIHKAFQDAISSVSSYTVSGNTLLLMKDANTVLMKCMPNE